jgi:hypothetical protein
VFKARCRAGGAPSHGGERRTRTVTLARSFVFETTPATLAGSLSTTALPPDVNRREMAEDDGPDPQRLSAPTRFPTEASRPAGSSSEESGRLKRHGVTRAVVSSDARSLTGSLSDEPGRGQANHPVRADRRGRDSPTTKRAPGGSRTRTPEDTGSWDRRGYQLRHQRFAPARARVTDRIRTGPASLASSRAEPLTLRSHGADDGT